MEIISKNIDALNEKIGIFTSYLIIPIIFITFFIAFMRYILDFGSIALQEIVIYLHAMVFMIGASYTLKSNMHVRIDIFYNKLSNNHKKKVDFYGTLFLLIPTCVLVFFSSYNYVLSSILLLESSKEAGGLPILYILKFYILLFSLALFLQAISELIKNHKNIK